MRTLSDSACALTMYMLVIAMIVLQCCTPVIQPWELVTHSSCVITEEPTNWCNKLDLSGIYVILGVARIITMVIPGNKRQYQVASYIYNITVTVVCRLNLKVKMCMKSKVTWYKIKI